MIDTLVSALAFAYFYSSERRQDGGMMLTLDVGASLESESTDSDAYNEASVADRTVSDYHAFDVNLGCPGPKQLKSVRDAESDLEMNQWSCIYEKYGLVRVFRKVCGDHQLIVKMFCGSKENDYENEVQSTFPLDRQTFEKVTVGDYEYALQPGVPNDGTCIRDFLNQRFDGQYTRAIVTHYRGQDLLDWIVNNQDKPRKDRNDAVKAVGRELLRLLDERPDISHNDIKPDNMVYDEKSKTATLIDWEGMSNNKAPPKSYPRPFTSGYQYFGAKDWPETDGEKKMWSRLNDAFASLLTMLMVHHVDDLSENLKKRVEGKLPEEALETILQHIRKAARDPEHLNVFNTDSRDAISAALDQSATPTAMPHAAAAESKSPCRNKQGQFASCDARPQGA